MTIMGLQFSLSRSKYLAAVRQRRAIKVAASRLQLTVRPGLFCQSLCQVSSRQIKQEARDSAANIDGARGSLSGEILSVLAGKAVSL